MNSPPTTLGQYQIIREIARSNDIVYEAYDPLMNRRVAIKELAMPQGASSQQQEERINRFKREAQAAGTLNHPNIMTVFSFAEDSGRTFMAMEYLDGGTLRNEIDTKGFLSVDRAIEISLEILEGLSHAHSKGVIHRDIKPDNIQILSNGTIKITDFGIARLTFQPNLTMDGQVFGTPSYMSPEQVVGRDIDPRSDLFSVGVVLFEMLSGQKPFAGDSVVSITYAIMNAEPVHPSQANFAMWQVLSRALEKSPQLRYANADEMAQALRDAQRASQSGTMASPPPAIGAYSVNPYQSPPPSPIAAPPVYAYNPYVAQQAPNQQSPYQTTPYQTAGYQYQPGPSMMPPAAIPIYYPPPPRQPLMKPETVSVLKRTLIAALILGTMFTLLLVGASSIVNVIRNYKDDNREKALADSLPPLPANMLLDDKISAVERDRVKFRGPQKAEMDHRLAMLYEAKGNESLQRADAKTAEFYFSKGTDLDPSNAALWSDEAHLYQSQMGGSQDPALMKAAGSAWDKAAHLENDSQKAFQYGKSAAQAYLGYAQSVLATGDRGNFQEARMALYSVKEMVTNDQELTRQISDMLAKLS